MKRLLKNKLLVLALVGAFTLTSVNCGIILHPERDGQKGGRLDATAVILDCLWLFVGVVPGVVALVVDFATGGIYESGGKNSLNVAPGQKFTFRLRGQAPQDAEIAVKLQGTDGQQAVLLLDLKVAQDEEAGLMEFALPAELAPGNYSMSLTVNDAPNAEWVLNVAQ